MRQTVVILGMHRSGTSMVAGILQCLGVDLGEDQPGKQWSNPLGHFEDVDFLSLNKAILTSAGGNWNNPPEYSKIIAQEEKLQPIIKELVQNRDAQSSGSLWGWKDPRTSLTIDLYLRYIQKPLVIWCRRDPMAIAKSLHKRNQIKIADGLELHEYYEDQIGEFINRNPRIPIFMVDYDEVIQAPEKWIDELIRFLQIDPGEDQISLALEKVLAPNEIQREKWLVWIHRLVSIPNRLIKRLFKRNE